MVLDGLVSAVDRKDRYTRRHSDNVTEAVVTIAERLSFGQRETDARRIAGPIPLARCPRRQEALTIAAFGRRCRIRQKPGQLLLEW